MSSALKFSLEIGDEDLSGQDLPRHPPGETEDVGIVMFSGFSGDEGVTAEGRPYAGYLVGHYAHPDPTAANQDAPVKLSPSYSLRHLSPHIRESTDWGS